MISKCQKCISNFGKPVRQMFAISWQAAPSCFAGVLLIETLLGTTPMLSAWITKLLFDLLVEGINSKELPWKSFFFLIVLQIGLAVFARLFQSLNSYLNSELTRQLIVKTQVLVYSKLNSITGLTPFENPRVHDTLQMGVQGALMGPGQMLGIFTNLLNSSVTLFGFIGAMIMFNPFLLILVIITTLPHFYAQLNLGHKRYGLALHNSPKQRRLSYYGHLLSGTEYAKEIRLFNLGEHFLQSFRILAEEINSTQKKQQKIELGYQTGLGLISSLVSNGSFLFVALQALKGLITVGDVSFYTSALSNVQGTLSSIFFSLSRVNESALFYNRYSELMSLEQPIYVPLKPQPLSHLKNCIVFRNVSFRYHDDQPWVLRNVNLIIPARQSLALVGLNGAGKTTFVKLLTRMYDPTEGQILWDGIDIRNFNPLELRNHMGVMFQDYVRFDLSAEENIVLGDVTMTSKKVKLIQERVFEAAKKAGIHEKIKGLPQGYQTILSRWLVEEGNGVDLSGGEWQKIGLARLFVRNAELVILDEPTSALDAEAEYDIYRQFKSLMINKTCILISHRFSSVRMADFIAVLEDGCVTEFGTHDQLLQSDKTYAHLFNLQAAFYR